MVMTRREFLHGAAGAAALATIRRQPQAGGMFVSLNGALTAGKGVGWPEFARNAARTRYCGVEVSQDAAEKSEADKPEAEKSEEAEPPREEKPATKKRRQNRRS